MRGVSLNLLAVQVGKQRADAPNSDTAGGGNTKSKEDLDVIDIAGDTDTSDTSVCAISDVPCLLLHTSSSVDAVA